MYAQNYINNLIIHNSKYTFSFLCMAENFHTEYPRLFDLVPYISPITEDK